MKLSKKAMKLNTLKGLEVLFMTILLTIKLHYYYKK